MVPCFWWPRWSPGDLERSLYEGQHHDQDPSDILNIQDAKICKDMQRDMSICPGDCEIPKMFYAALEKIERQMGGQDTLKRETGYPHHIDLTSGCDNDEIF